MGNYRNTIVESLHLLELVRDRIFTQVVNISSEGELKEILNVFEEGDSYEFDMDQFENSNDINVARLMELCHKIEEIYDTIQNVNAVQQEELIPELSKQ